jgi:hypothetical protein
MECRNCGASNGTGLEEEAEFWIEEKGIEGQITKSKLKEAGYKNFEQLKDDIVEELVSRWDNLADEEIMDIVGELGIDLDEDED